MGTDSLLRETILYYGEFPVYKTTFTYDEDGNLILSSFDDDADGDIDETTEYAYDDRGNLIGEVSQFPQIGGFTSEYTYDENDNILQKETVFFDEITRSESTVEEYYTYDENGTLRTYSVDSDGDGVFEVTATYDEKGNEISRTENYDVDDVITIISSEYDEN
ncbi:MAG: hypothetical protein AAFP20_11525, partial [Cyanobacteria bacterium J06614_10]